MEEHWRKIGEQLKNDWRRRRIFSCARRTTGRNKMSVLASTFEIGAHPATALLVGGLATAVLRGRFASFALILAPGADPAAASFFRQGILLPRHKCYCPCCTPAEGQCFPCSRVARPVPLQHQSAFPRASHSSRCRTRWAS